MKVCVIGAGPNGLTTIRQLLDEGHEVTCFERSADIGGIWYRHENDHEETKAFDSLVLTISMKLMSFSDFIHEGERTFATHQGYFRYLQAYAENYGLKDHIRLNTAVNDVTHQDATWRIGVTTNGTRTEHVFDAVALCIGPFQRPNRNIREIQPFTGEVVHSATYRNNRLFVGKRVLALGLAESGADVIREISDVASDFTLSIRSRSFLLARQYLGKFSTDQQTLRAHHFEMWARATKEPVPFRTLWGEHWSSRAVFFTLISIYGVLAFLWNGIQRLLGRGGSSEVQQRDNLGQPAYPPKLDLFTENTAENVAFIDEWNRKSHKYEGNWSPKIIFAKNVSFVPNVLNGKITVNDSGIDRTEGRRVYFRDGTVKEFDTIVLCTGYRPDFSILGDIKIKDNNVRNLYKHAFHPQHGGRLAVIGVVRPFSGGIPVCSEMQARYFALLCSGKLRLPSDVEERIQKEKAWEDKWTCLSPRAYDAVPSQIMFMDSIAREIGCLMPLSKLILNPRLMVKLWFYAFNQSCYRLVGPHSMPESARRHVLAEKLPADSNWSILGFIILSLLPHFIHPKHTLCEIPRR
jgi:thioredoxin reductase